MAGFMAGFPGEHINSSKDVAISTQGVGKPQYFASGAMGYKLPTDLPANIAAEWKREYALCDCSTCYDTECVVKHKNVRFPQDAGGQDQCLRLMESKTRFVWRNGNGEVITIPPAIIEAIKGE